MALPEGDWPQIHQWAERNSGGQDPDINPDGYVDTTSNDGSVAMAMYGDGVRGTRGAAKAATTSVPCCSRRRSTAGR